MSKTGDIQNNFEKLKAELKSVKYPNLNQLYQGDGQHQILEGKPFAFLPLIHHLLLVYSPHVTNFVTQNGFELYAKTDMRFMESVYKLFLNQLEYRPAITITQFFTEGFAERKIILCADMTRIIRAKHVELAKLVPKQKHLPQKNLVEKSVQFQQDQQAVAPDKYRVINHKMDQVPQKTQFEPLPQVGISESLPTILPQTMQENSSQYLQHKYGVQPQQPQPMQQAQSVQQIYNDSSYLQKTSEPTMSVAIDNQSQNDVIKMLVNLNEGVKSLGRRFDSFQGQTESKMQKLEAEMLLLHNKVDMLETKPQRDVSRLPQPTAQPYVPNLGQSSFARESPPQMQRATEPQKGNDDNDDFIRKISERYAETKKLLSQNEFK